MNVVLDYLDLMTKVYKKDWLKHDKKYKWFNIYFGKRFRRICLESTLCHQAREAVYFTIVQLSCLWPTFTGSIPVGVVVVMMIQIKKSLKFCFLDNVFSLIMIFEFTN